ncbi:MAG: hypothetical protein ABIG42_04940, partial [bacterium]
PRVTRSTYMDEVSELKQELQQMRVELEVEKQKNAKLQQELEIAQRKIGKAGGRAGPIPVVKPTIQPRATVQFDMGDTPVTQEELGRLQNLLNETQSRLDMIESEKWEVQKKNIELKENLQRLKVQGSNYKKDIEQMSEKVDRKENQNFKVRLELTDTRKELASSTEEQEKQDKILKKLDGQIAEVAVQVGKLEVIFKEESLKRDKINNEYVKARDLLAQYEDHWLAKIYNR